MKSFLLILSLLSLGVSLIGVLFIANGLIVFGIVGFILSALTRDNPQPFGLKKTWAAFGPVFIVMFLTCVILSVPFGAPKLDNLPVFALRDHYLFSRGGEVSRWRFVTVGACFSIAWHGAVMLITLDGLIFRWFSRTP